jgi:hypothetical protein
VTLAEEVAISGDTISLTWRPARIIAKSGCRHGRSADRTAAAPFEEAVRFAGLTASSTKAQGAKGLSQRPQGKQQTATKKKPARKLASRDSAGRI